MRKGSVAAVSARWGFFLVLFFFVLVAAGLLLRTRSAALRLEILGEVLLRSALAGALLSAFCIACLLLLIVLPIRLADRKRRAD
jgi:hypothetical protein